MYPSPPDATESFSPEALSLAGTPNADRLENIRTRSHLILMALESLTKIDSEAIARGARELGLEETIGDRLSPWRKKLDVEEARALVLVICHLARRHHELIRRGVILLEQVTAANREPHRASLLGDYLDAFGNAYRERMEDGETIPPEHLTELALKLLIDLLFYSARDGHRRLWLTSIE